MSEKFVNALNTISGKIGPVPVGYLDHPVFKDQLVLADEGQKPYASALYKPKTVEEFAETNTAFVDAERDPITDEDDEEDDA